MEQQLGEASLKNPLAELLRVIAMRPESLIARINELRGPRGSLHLDLKSAYPWMRTPAVRPNEENQRDALSVLSTRAGRRVTADELGWTGPRRRRHARLLDAPADAPAGELLREISQGDAMDRRTLLLLSGAAVTAPGLALLIADDSLPAAESGDHVSAQLVSSIENSVHELRDVDDAAGSTTGLVWAGGLWQSVARVVDNARFNSSEGRRLHTAFIELCEQYGWMLFDADMHPLAQRVFQTGMRLAREVSLSGPGSYATHNLVASSAYQSSWLGQHPEAKTLLGIANRGDLPPRVKAVVAERAIFAAGRRGDTEALRRARDTAHDALSDAGGDGPWWSQWLSPLAIDAATGRAWLAARQSSAAEPYLTRRLAAAEAEAFPRDRMLASLDLADTYRVAGDPDAAANLGLQAAGLARSVNSARAQTRLTEIATALAGHRHRPVVRAFVDAVAGPPGGFAKTML
jgi:hypothetical protein